MVDLGKKKRRYAVGSDCCHYVFAKYLRYHYIEWTINFRRGVRTTIPSGMAIMLKWVHGKLKSAGGIKYPVSRRPLVIEPHLGGCDSCDACDEGARKQYWQPRCEPNAHPSWIGYGSFLVKRFQCSSNN